MNDALNAPLNSAVTANSESPSNVASGSSIPHEPIAIVGIGCAFPKAPSVDEFWQNIKHGVDGITDVPDTHWRLSDYFDADPNAPDMTYGCRGGFLEPAPFDTLEFGIAPRNLEATDTSQLFAMLAARDALRDAGYAPDAKKGEGKPFNRERTSVILGVTGALELVIPLGARLGHPQWRAGLQDAGVSAELADEVVSRISEQFVDWQENSFPGLLGNVAAGRVANRFDLGGTNCVVDAACASSLGALHLAILELQSGRADVALSGGIDTFNDIFMYMCFSKTPALSPTGESRPFDHDGDGTILGEGAGVLMLKRLSDAQRDGDHIRAVIKGIGSSSDGRGNAIYAPSAHGQQRALRAAFADAGVTPDTIELFEAHGTGTRVGDATEVDSLTSVFGEAERVGTWCALGSVKSMIGHTKAAAGVAGLIKAALALEHKVLPPTLKVNQPLANLAAGQVPVYINANARPWVGHGHHPRRASLSAFGFGGSNFHCVLEEFEGAESRVDWGGDTLIFAVSAPAAPALSQRLADYIGPLLETPAQASTQTSIAAREHWRHARAVAANTRQQFDPNDGARAIIVLQRTQVLVQSLADELRQRAALVTSIAAQLTPAGFASRDDVFVGLGPVPGRVAVLFPGQGSQRPDMLKDLACQFPEFLDVMQAANAALGPVTDQGPSVSELSELVYPHAAFDPETKKRQAEQLRNTQFAQPALGASELAAWDVLQRFGLEADGFAGHSFGELVALTAAGRLNRTELLELAVLRGQLMAGDGSDRGGMLAVALPAQALESWLADTEFDLVVANINGPQQTVLSGATPVIALAHQKLKADGIQAIALPVSGAFHSPLMADAAAPFATALEALSFAPPANGSCVYANTTASPYSDDPQAARDTLAQQLTSTVRFVELVENMHAAGFATFLEVGPGRVLGGMTRQILDNAPEGTAPTVLSLDESGGRVCGEIDLARTLATLASLGHRLNLSAWDPVSGEYEAPRRSPATVEITGANKKTSRTRTPPRTANPSVHSEPQYHDSRSPADAPSDIGLNTGPNTGPDTGHGFNDRTNEIPMPLSQPGSSPPLTAPQPNDPTDSTPTQPHRHAISSAASSVSQNAPPTNPAAAEEVIRTLARMQEQTASLHSQYLDSVASTQDSILAIAQQMGAQPFAHSPGLPLTPAPSVVEAAMSADASSPLSSEVPDNSPGSPAVATLSTPVPTFPVAPPDASLTEASIAVATTTAGASPAVQSAGNWDALALVLQVVAEKTGYPIEMLNAQMELDADLGIDSIKRVEILSAVQDLLPGGAEPSAEDLAELVTLGDVVALLAPIAAAQPEVASAASATFGSAQILSGTQSAAGNPVALTPTTASHGAAEGLDVASIVLAIVAEKTGYPPEMLTPDMHLDADLGIDSIKRVEILSALEERVPGTEPPDPQAIAELQTLGDVIAHIGAAAPESATSVRSVPEALAPGGASQGTHDQTSTGRLSTAQVGNASVSDPDLEALLVGIVAEKTGYPADILGLDMQLDADLGIDSIKRVEILSSLEETLNLGPLADPEALGQLDTLGSVLTLVRAAATGAKGGPANGSAHAWAASANTPVGERALAGEQSDDKPTYEAPLIVHTPTTVAIGNTQRRILDIDRASEIWVTDDGTALGENICKALAAHGVSARVVPWDATPNGHAIAGVILSSPVDDDPALLQNATALVQRLSGALALEGRRGDTLVVALTRLGGHFGIEPGPAPTAAGSAALGGLVKSLAHEWPHVSCKVVDVRGEDSRGEQGEPFELANVAADIADEVLLTGPVEVGLCADGRVSVELTPVAVAPSPSTTPSLDLDAAVLFSGGARGITAELAFALSQRTGCPAVLLGRTSIDQTEPDWLSDAPDETGIKRALNEHGSYASPADLQREASATLARREVRQTLERFANAELTVRYVSVDVTDEVALASALDAVRQDMGPICGLIHGAGVIADRRIEDKTAEQIAAVYDTKVSALNTLLKALEPELKLIGLFSSSSARFGRHGQSDYAAANEVLNKTARILAARHRDMRVVSFNWGPWDGGMVTPSLARLFNAEGVGLIGVTQGVKLALDYLVGGVPSNAIEVVVGALAPGHEIGADSKHDDTAAPRVEPRVTQPIATTESSAPTAQLPTVIAAVTSPPLALANSELRVARAHTVSVEALPLLRSHVLAGKAVLPLVVSNEWLIQAAMHHNPGLYFHGVDELQVLSALRVDAHEDLQVHASANLGTHDAQTVRVATALSSERAMHVKGDVVLSPTPEFPVPADMPRLGTGTGSGASTALSSRWTQAALYDGQTLFHGPEFHAIEDVLHLSKAGITARIKASPAPATWFRHPWRATWVADPLAIDAGFQLMVIWCLEYVGAHSLPTFIKKYRQFTRAFPKQGALVECRITKASTHRVNADIAFYAADETPLAMLTGYECVVDASLAPAFSARTLITDSRVTDSGPDGSAPTLRTVAQGQHGQD